MTFPDYLKAVRERCEKAYVGDRRLIAMAHDYTINEGSDSANAQSWFDGYKKAQADLTKSVTDVPTLERAASIMYEKLKMFSKQQAPEEYEEDHGEEMDDANAAEAYEYLVLEARKATAAVQSLVNAGLSATSAKEKDL